MNQTTAVALIVISSLNLVATGTLVFVLNKAKKQMDNEVTTTKSKVGTALHDFKKALEKIEL